MKRYEEPPNIAFLAQDYAKELSIGTDYDVLLSQYAGFVSEKCKNIFVKVVYSLQITITVMRALHQSTTTSS
jgi:hypothetical protein